jgi:hypothetical protein
MLHLSSLTRGSSGIGNLENLCRGTLQNARHENRRHHAEEFHPVLSIFEVVGEVDVAQLEEINALVSR